MVEVEIRSPFYDEESQEVAWRVLARVHADGRLIEIEGDDIPSDSVISATTGNIVHRDDHPEEWARNLPYAYRAGDPVAVVLHDDDPPALARGQDVDEPVIPDAPVPEFSEDGAVGASA